MFRDNVVVIYGDPCEADTTPFNIFVNIGGAVSEKGCYNLNCFAVNNSAEHFGYIWQIYINWCEKVAG